jgi:hypothetical protein
MPSTVHQIQQLRQRARKRKQPALVKGPESHELLTVEQFAHRVRRDKQTCYRWIRRREMPEGSVVMVHGHLYVNWTVYRERGVQPVL